MDVRPWFHRCTLFGSVAAALVTLSCGAGTAPSSRTVSDDGQVCLRNESGDFESVDSGRLVARVVFDTCISSTCDEVQYRECSVERDGSNLQVTSEVEVLSKGGPCSADCGTVSATCEVPQLGPGEYQLEHGDDSGAFTLPSDDSICIGEAP